MARVPKKLTDRRVDSLKKRDKSYFVFDGDGLFLDVRKTGKKIWRVRCPFEGRKVVVTLGEYPSMSLADARNELNKIKSFPVGANPQDAYKAERAGRSEYSFRKLAIDLFNSKPVSDMYRTGVINSLNNHVFPVIGNTDIRNIDGAELFNLFISISNHVNDRSGKQTVRLSQSLCGWCSEVFDYAGLVISGFSSNPCRLIKKRLKNIPTQTARRIDFDSMPDLLKNLSSYTSYMPTVKAGLMIMLYTGQRQASLFNARWGDFDLDNAVWVRRPEKKDVKSHILPLPAQAVSILKKLKSLNRHTGNDDFVFVGIDGVHVISRPCISRLLRNVGADMVGHGIRGLVTTGLNELSKTDARLIGMGINKDVIECQIGHRVRGVASHYDDSLYFNVRKEMMQIWADYLDSITPKKTEK